MSLMSCTALAPRVVYVWAGQRMVAYGEIARTLAPRPQLSVPKFLKRVSGGATDLYGTAK